KRSRQSRPPLFPYTTLFRSPQQPRAHRLADRLHLAPPPPGLDEHRGHQLLGVGPAGGAAKAVVVDGAGVALEQRPEALGVAADRSEEHTSELQSRENLVCRL